MNKELSGKNNLRQYPCYNVSMNERPLISVIISCYNYGKYIGEAIRSVFKQTYTNLELIIINDGSIDNSDDIIKKELKKTPSGIKTNYIHQKKNRGLVYVRNKGLELTRGEYFCFLDADDFFDIDYIEKSYEVARKTKAGIVYPNWHIFDAWEEERVFPNFELGLLLEHKLHISPESLIKTKSVELNRKVAEDWDFFIGMALKGVKIVRNPDGFINYRVKLDSRSNKDGRMYSMRILYEILQKWQRKYTEKINFNLLLNEIEHLHDMQESLQRELTKANQQIANKNDEIRIKDEEIWWITNSRSYKVGRMILAPYRIAKRVFGRVVYKKQKPLVAK